MKKMLLLLLITPVLIFAKTYMAKIEPFDTFNVYAQKAGQIVYLDKNDENKIINKKIVQIDDELDRITLKNYQEQLGLYEKEFKIKNSNYEKFKTIRGKSAFDKDDKLIEVINLKISISSLKNSIAELKDSIKKKSITIKNLYLKSYTVNKMDYVNIGTKIAELYDVSSSKIVVYVLKEDLKDIKKKKVFIDGKLSDAKVIKKDITVDPKYMTSYKVEIKSSIKEFGKVVNVEFR